MTGPFHSLERFLDFTNFRNELLPDWPIWSVTVAYQLVDDVFTIFLATLPPLLSSPSEWKLFESLPGLLTPYVGIQITIQC